MFKEIDTELQLVFAGSHDRSLEGKYSRSQLLEGRDPEEYSQALRLMTGPLAAEAGVTYREELDYGFTLNREQ